MKYFIEHGDNVFVMISSVVRWSCFYMKITKFYNTLSGTYKIQENMHDFVVLTVKIDKEKSPVRQSQNFSFSFHAIIYNSYSLYKLFYLKLISDEAFRYYSPPKTPCGKTPEEGYIWT